MRKLPKPCDSDGNPFLASHVYGTCISRVRNPSLKNRLEAIANSIASAAEDYDNLATATQLHLFPRAETIGNVTSEELVKVYVARMAKKTQPGRYFYDKIICAPKHGRCPLCDLGSVTTLDHHLPKTHYPSMVVAPNNLVPSCTWCQDKKKDNAPSRADEQTLHPYFDDCETESWLKAEVVESIPAVFEYSVVGPVSWSDLMVKRLKHHIKAFQLKELYALNAASELSEIRGRLRTLFEAGAAAAVASHLREEAESREQVGKNSWKAAMYRAAAASEWFCNGGFSSE